jgi:hypothetical protein
MKLQIEQNVILRLSPEEANWLKGLLAEPPAMGERPSQEKQRIELHLMLHEALNELQY